MAWDAITPSLILRSAQIAENGKQKPMKPKSGKRRYILALSSGKDSAALAVYLKDRILNIDYVSVLIKRR